MRRRLARFVLAWLGLIVLAGGTVESHPARRLHLDIYPRISYAPATIRLMVVIEPQEDQRSLRIETDNGTFGRTTEIPLDGANGPRTSYLAWQAIPAGEYLVIARVATLSHVVATTEGAMIVLP